MRRNKKPVPDHRKHPAFLKVVDGYEDEMTGIRVLEVEYEPTAWTTLTGPPRPGWPAGTWPVRGRKLCCKMSVRPCGGDTGQTASGPSGRC